ncbi:BQ2448_5957 [Microbotryum intermedium]|uniref:BQ2448_5957 protein n=1 Tax=Microbotryum intermedium TaxID=269621 RepID=A0A238F5R8_9BASI|nr:BQ2448_5957 [Microbotryum intermedium]
MQGFGAWKATIGLGAVVTLVVLTPFHDSTRVAAGAVTGGPMAGKANTFEIIGETGASAQQLFLGTEDLLYVIDKTENNRSTDAQFYEIRQWGTEYRLKDNTYRAMNVQTNTFCAGGNLLANGFWINVGGNQAVDKRGRTTGNKKGKYQEEPGGRAIRTLLPKLDGTAEWVEDEFGMPVNRWYPYVEIMGNGSAMIIGGEMWGGFVDSVKEKQNVSSIEYFPSQGEPHFLPFLAKTGPANLYPLTWLLPNGNVFMQADWKTQILDPIMWEETLLPDVPIAQRTYPASGATVMLPLTPANNYKVTLLFCGGLTPERDDWDVLKWNIAETPASDSCVSINPEDGADARWEHDDSLPEGRTMGNFIILPTGKILLLNGAGKGAAGYGRLSWAINESFAQDPVLRPALYNPSAPKASRFTTIGMPNTTIARMYHSTASLLADGSVVVAGSNPNGDVVTEENNSTYLFKTEYRAEKYYPSYFDKVRPKASVIPTSLSYGGDLFQFDLPPSTFTNDAEPDSIRVVLVRTGFSTHAMNMGMKLIQLRHTYTINQDNSVTVNVAQLPSNPNLFQPGPALFFVVVNEVPSIGRYVMVGNGKLGQQSVAEDTVLPPSSGKFASPTSGASSGSGSSSSPLSKITGGAIPQVGGSLSLVESVGAANGSSSMPLMDMSNTTGKMSKMAMPTSSASKSLLSMSAGISMQGLIVLMGVWLLA